MASALVQDLVDRRVPQYLALYVGGSWGLVQFFAFMEDRFLLSPHWTNLMLLLVALLLPSVALFTYFHGRTGVDRWARIEKFFIPANVVVTLVVLFTMFSGKDLGAVTATVVVEDEEGNEVERVVPKSEFRKTVALFTPATDTADADQAWLGYGVLNGLMNDLYQDMFLDLRPSALFRDKLREAGFTADADAPTTLKRRLTQEAHVPYFVDGSAERTDAGYRLTLALHDVERGRVVTERVHEGADLMAVIDSASLQLRRDLELPTRHLEETADVAVAEHTTSSVEALRHYALGIEALWEDDDYPAARAAFEAALEADPAFADAAFTLYNVLVFMGDVQSAGGALQVAMDNLYRLPDRTHYQVKGEWYGMQQDFPKMFAVFEMWAELYPQDLNAQNAVAQMRIYQGDNEGAIRAFEKMLELDPTKIELLPRIGSLYEQLGETAQAREYYERHVAAAPEDESSLTSLAGLYRRAGEHEEARRYYERAQLLEPGDVGLTVRVASLDRALGNFDAALEGYESALATAKTDEQRARALGALASYHSFRGRMEESLRYREQALQTAAKVEPPIAVIQGRLLNLDLYVHVGREDEALRMLESLSAQLTPPLDMLVPIGQMGVYEAMERPDELAAAVEAGHEMLERLGMNVLEQPVVYHEGRLHELRGEWRQAIEAYERERDLAPTDATIPAQLGRAYRELGDLDRAEDLILETLNVIPADGRANYELALVYEKMGRANRAMAHLERALETWAGADERYVWAARARDAMDRLGG